MNIAKFLRTAFFITFIGCFCQFDKVANCSILSICLAINQKYNMGWFLLKRFLHLCRASSLHIVSRNHYNTLLLINMQEQKLVQNKYIAVKTICSDLRILTVSTGFCPLLNVYPNDLEINRWLHLSG